MGSPRTIVGSETKDTTMFIDTSKCIGCRACQMACKQWHSLPVEGDEGTATGSTSNTLVDITRTPTPPPPATNTNPLSWKTNQWVDYGVEIFAGTGAGQKRTIKSNTADTLTVSPDWTTLPGVTSEYAISTTFTGSYTNPPDLAGNTLSVVRFIESRTSEWPYVSDPGTSPWLFLKDQCRHCYQPKCKRVCPTGIFKTKEGFVLFRENCNDVHINLRKVKNPNFDKGQPVGPNNPRTIPQTFADFCPYHIPRYSAAAGQYVKCDFCYDRFATDADHPTDIHRDKSVLGISSSYTTACEYACPTGAIITGPYKEIIGYSDSYAKERFRAIRPTYKNANLYLGRKGRVGVIYLLTDLPENYGLDSLPA